jgi:hypothetical protein
MRGQLGRNLATIQRNPYYPNFGYLIFRFTQLAVSDEIKLPE